MMPKNMRADEKSYIDKFADALAGLDNIKNIYTDPNLTGIRRGMRDVLQHDRNETVTEHLVQAFELYGIAQALAVRFDGTEHESYARSGLWTLACSLRLSANISPPSLCAHPVLRMAFATTCAAAGYTGSTRTLPRKTTTLWATQARAFALSWRTSNR
ncbi:hypothetical protein BDV98DRAFT_71411 [Pterulicium gracile]|uniref:Uncharacterized protein n=1 Tax=Pterulicium gracile TaxID=1884261 RepID=A0A5C3QKG6_9AGAR|nr:hypothetical protein BDV98DRAFT_71411 [Pterula gracilis]